MKRSEPQPCQFCGAEVIVASFGAEGSCYGLTLQELNGPIIRFDSSGGLVMQSITSYTLHTCNDKKERNQHGEE